MVTKKKRAEKQIEWVGGLVRLPAYVTGEGEPYRPAAAVWLSPADKLVLGMEVFGREGRPEEVVASFEAATRKPLAGARTRRAGCAWPLRISRTRCSRRSRPGSR